MILQLSLDLPEDMSYNRTARDLGRTLLEGLNVLKQDIDDVEIIVDELTSNAIRHAESEEACFRLELQYFAEKVVITVIDRGTGFLFKDVPAMGAPRADIDGGVRYGGFGIPMVDALADRLRFSRTDPHGTT